MPDVNATHPSDDARATRPGWAAAVLIAWAALIFATSCTVIRPAEFFELIHRYLITDERFFSGFEVFWGVSWFAVVKGWHALEFAILFLLATSLITRIAGRHSTRAVLLAAACTLAFAATDEWHQTFVPDRNGTVQDVLIDSLGVLVAAVFVWRPPSAH